MTTSEDIARRLTMPERRVLLSGEGTLPAQRMLHLGLMTMARGIRLSGKRVIAFERLEWTHEGRQVRRIIRKWASNNGGEPKAPRSKGMQPLRWLRT